MPRFAFNLRSILTYPSTRILFYTYLGILLFTGYFVYAGHRHARQAFEQETRGKLQAISRQVASYLELQLLKAQGHPLERPALPPEWQAHLRGMQRDSLPDGVVELWRPSADAKSWTSLAMLASDSLAALLPQRTPTEKLPAALTAAPPEHFESWRFETSYLRDPSGKHIALVRCGRSISSGLQQVDQLYLAYALFALALIAVIVGLLLRLMYRILHQQETDRERLVQALATRQKNREMTSSIQYARRIQKSMLPSSEMIRNTLGDAFVYFRPRDIVSGDFYWLHEAEDRYLFAIADCVGHGVPGAFTSMIGKTLLDQIVKQEAYRDPGAILDVLDERFQRWMVHAEADGWREGMDVVLCALDKNHQRISFAGAHRPVLLLRDQEVLEWRTDRRPIGGSSRYKRPPFREQTIELQPEDQLYLFTDGYTDQMGGPEYRKFKHGRFHRHLLKHSHLPMAQQLKSLSRQFRSWKGDYRQMDDILVLGLRIEPVPDPIPIAS